MEEKGLGDLGQPQPARPGLRGLRTSGASNFAVSNTPNPHPHPNRNSRNPPQAAPHSPPPLALPGSRGQEPPNYFQMWTQPRGHGGEGGGEMRSHGYGPHVEPGDQISPAPNLCPAPVPAKYLSI